MSNTIWNVRPYEKPDWETVSGWWDVHAHGSGIVQALLPPLGVVVEMDEKPVCAVWLYMAAGIGVCWLEYPVSAPGLKFHDAKEAFHLAVSALEKAAKANDYGVMIAHTLPAIARVMRSFGFREETRKKVTTLKVLT